MTPGTRQAAHATLIAAWRAGLWRGVLLRGPSGAGKSDLALRALAAGWGLVADDRVRLWVDDGVLYGAAPARLSGLVEARDLGVVSRAALRFARVAAVAETLTGEAERTPEPAWATIEGVRIPRFRMRFGEPGAVARLDLALDAALRRRPTL